MAKSSGKTLTIFVVVIGILLVSLASISIFFFLKEVELRRSAEEHIQQLRNLEAKLSGDLKEAKQQVYLAEQKGKEMEDRVESLLEDLELEIGLKEEAKSKNRTLEEDLKKEVQAREELRRQIEAETQTAQEKIGVLQERIALLEERNKELEARRQELERQTHLFPGEGEMSGAAGGENVDLEKIVVAPGAGGEGSVISVDEQADFVIVSLGQQHNLQKGAVLAVYRQDEYLGDVTVSRVLEDMSAAEFVPPLSAETVQKGDRVVRK